MDFGLAAQQEAAEGPVLLDNTESALRHNRAVDTKLDSRFTGDVPKGAFAQTYEIPVYLQPLIPLGLVAFGAKETAGTVFAPVDGGCADKAGLALASALAYRPESHAATANICVLLTVLANCNEAGVGFEDESTGELTDRNTDAQGIDDPVGFESADGMVAFRGESIYELWTGIPAIY